MKSYIIISALVLAFNVRANDEKTIQANLNEVTVFAQGAQLYHSANYLVKPGITKIIIEGISPTIDPKTLQVKITGSLILLDAKYDLFYPKPEALSLEGLPLTIKKDIDKLEDSISVVAYALQEIQDEIDVLNASKAILANNGAIKGQGKVNDSLNLLKQAVDYYSLKMNEFNKKLQVLQKRKKEKNLILSGMNERLNKLRNYQNNEEFRLKEQGPKHRVVVMVQSAEGASGKISLSYISQNASWQPRYDLRSDGMNGKINLTYKANISQSTGIDWDNVKLNISTNNPYQNKTKPNLHPWYIDYYTYRNTQVPQPGMPAQRAKEQAGAEKDGMSYSNVIDQEAMTSADFVETIRQLSSIEFRIDLPYSIKSNSEEHMVLIKNTDLQATYKYYAVPKMDNGVYLMAQLTKLEDLGLVPAPANLFFDGSYIGETYIDPSAMEDTLNLGMGRDPNIIIKRKLLKKEIKEKIIGEKKERTFTYSIEVKNLKATPIELVIQDQIPVTTNADIEVEALELAKATYDQRTGFLDWTINLKSKESKTIDFSFKVRHNKAMDVVIY